MPFVTETSRGVSARYGAKARAVVRTANDGVANTTISLLCAQAGSAE